jgi:hypothetical protein
VGIIIHRVDAVDNYLVSSTSDSVLRIQDSVPSTTGALIDSARLQ